MSLKTCLIFYHPYHGESSEDTFVQINTGHFSPSSYNLMWNKWLAPAVFPYSTTTFTKRAYFFINGWQRICDSRVVDVHGWCPSFAIRSPSYSITVAITSPLIV